MVKEDDIVMGQDAFKGLGDDEMKSLSRRIKKYNDLIVRIDNEAMKTIGEQGKEDEDSDNVDDVPHIEVRWIERMRSKVWSIEIYEDAVRNFFKV